MPFKFHFISNGSLRTCHKKMSLTLKGFPDIVIYIATSLRSLLKTTFSHPHWFCRFVLIFDPKKPHLGHLYGQFTIRYPIVTFCTVFFFYSSFISNSYRYFCSLEQLKVFFDNHLKNVVHFWYACSVLSVCTLYMFLVCLIYDLNNNISCENKKGDLCACMYLFVFVCITYMDVLTLLLLKSMITSFSARRHVTTTAQMVSKYSTSPSITNSFNHFETKNHSVFAFQAGWLFFLFSSSKFMTRAGSQSNIVKNK